MESPYRKLRRLDRIRKNPKNGIVRKGSSEDEEINLLITVIMMSLLGLVMLVKLFLLFI